MKYNLFMIFFGISCTWASEHTSHHTLLVNIVLFYNWPQSPRVFFLTQSGDACEGWVLALGRGGVTVTMSVTELKCLGRISVADTPKYKALHGVDSCAVSCISCLAYRTSNAIFKN